MTKLGGARHGESVSSGLAALRESLGITQRHLAAALRVRQAAVSQIESRGDPHVGTLRRYVAALGGALEFRVLLPGRKPVILTLRCGGGS